MTDSLTTACSQEARDFVDRFPAPHWYPQQEQWIRDPFGSDNACFNYPLALRIEGPLHRDALRLGLEELVRRHQPFRSVFSMEGNQAVQTVLSSHPFAIEQVDLEFLPAEERECHARGMAVELAQRAFDLTREPLLRATLLRLGTEDHVLLLMTHHLACDDWSTGILFRELSELYSAFSAGQPSPLSELRYQYGDFARQLAREMQGEGRESRLQFWQTQLEGGGDRLHLTGDHPRSDARTFRAKHEGVIVDAELNRALKNLSQRNGTSCFMTLVAGFLCLLRRYSGRDDVDVGACVANRNWVEVEELIGPFSNRVVLRTDLSGKLTVRDVLKEVRDVSWEAYAYQDLPFGEITRRLEPAGGSHLNPLIQTLIVYQNAPKHPWKFRGLTVNWLPLEVGTACYDLHIWLRDEEEMEVSLQYNASLFEPETVRQLLSDYRNILATMARNPEGLLEDLTPSRPKPELVELDNPGESAWLWMGDAAPEGRIPCQ